ncbi:MAG: hypothetical protein P4L40_19125 [Terracidiphilus sp.]|nr:hypothetical protein [Terracidiphilus sp.]
MFLCVQVLGFGGEAVVGVACGREFTLFLTASGAVYACGVDDDGQLGKCWCVSVWGVQCSRRKHNVRVCVRACVCVQARASGRRVC